MVQYWSDPAALWRDPYHDRNTHYRDGLNLALDLRNLDPIAFVADATSDPIWPPLFPVALGFVLAAGGLDHRLAIVPALLAWCATAALTAMLAERAASSRLAGVVAGGLALASPAFRLLGADVMFESSGAALGAAAILLYLHGAARRGLALVLTALFLTKYNYWLLIITPLAVSASLDAGLERTREAVCALLWCARRVAFSWLGAAGITVSASAAVMSLLGPVPVALLGRTYAIDPGLVLTFGYGAVFLRCCTVWAAGGRERVAALGPTPLAIARLHVLPAGLWLLTPRALGRLLFFVSQPAGDAYDPAAALAFQWAGFSEGYHPLGPAVAVLALAVIGGVQLAPRTRRRSVAITALLGAAAVLLHPYQQWRFAATGLFALWACAGVGAAALTRPLPPRFRPAAAAACAGLILLTAVQPADLADRVAIRSPSAPSDLALADSYLPLLADSHDVGVVTTFGLSDLFVWTIREQCGCRITVDQPWLQRAASPADAAALTRAWLEQTQADHVVLVDAPPPYPLPGFADLAARLAEVPAVLRSSTRLERMAAPAHIGLATVEVWRTTEAPASPRPARRHLDAWASLGIALLAAPILLWPRHRAALPPG